jgi:hypothetical protein
MEFIIKIRKRIWSVIISYCKNTKYYPNLYKSYWYFLFRKNKLSDNVNNFYAAIPNPGAGIGHQMANWIAGYWFSQKFDLRFAHISFAKANWESFLGFGLGEKNIDDLLASGYKKVRLPLFDEFNDAEVELQKKIISSYSNKKVVFVAEQDQGYRDQFGVISAIQDKFYAAPARRQDQLIYDPNYFNISVHVRRGDIVIGKKTLNANLLMRWQGSDYFVKLLENVLNRIETSKPIAIYLFSEGVDSDFPEFEQFENLHFCLDMNAQDSFLHMVFADLLITSKSSFSYKPALLNRNIKVCPRVFWHGYPKTKDWIMVNENGTLQTDVNE